MPMHLLHPQRNCDPGNNIQYMCNNTKCTITITDEERKGSFFLYICGDYIGGILQTTAGTIVSIRQFCASLYSCSDPVNCWTKDIRTDGAAGLGTLVLGTRVKAVSIMPGCEMTGDK